LSGYLYSSGSKAIAIHHYVSSEAQFAIDGHEARLSAKSNFPLDGAASIRFEETPGTPFEVLLRIPGWAGSHHFAVNGKEVVPATVAGFAAIARIWSSGDEITVRFEMPVQAHYSHYEVTGNRRRVAVSLAR
jgi:uncharacterized protein